MKGLNYDKWCLMLDISIANWNKIINSIIEPQDIYHLEGLGVELDPHITVLYGLLDVNWEDVALYCYPNSKIKLKVTGIDTFETNENYDVVFFSVESRALEAMNYKLVHNFDVSLTHKEYHPHMTLAYVKKGTGKKYVKKLKNKFLKPKKYRLTGPNGYIKTWTMQEKKEK